MTVHAPRPAVTKPHADIPRESLCARVAAVTGVCATPVRDEVELALIEGQVPSDIDGFVLQNGPGRQSRGGTPYRHPFDGDGFLQRLSFHDGRARYRADWVKTPEWAREEAAGRILFRSFGTNRPGGLLANLFDLRFKNAANTSIVSHAGRTLALWEGGVPHEIDPETLETLGRYDYGGRLRNRRSVLDRWLNPELPFAAHPRLDPATGELFSFGAAHGVRSHLLIHRVSAEGVLDTTWVRLPRLPFVHDFVLTKRHCVFVLPPVTFDIPAALLGLASPVASLREMNGPCLVLLWPRDGGAPRFVELALGFVFHWAHGYEAPNGDIVMVGMEYPSFPQIEDIASCTSVPRPVRVTIDPSGGSTVERLADHLMELPTTHASFDGPLAPIFGVSAPPTRSIPAMTGLGRLEPDGRYLHRDLFPSLPGEPCLVANGRWLVVWVAPPEGPGEIWVVDPETLGTRARLRLPHAVPTALHATWTPT